MKVVGIALIVFGLVDAAGSFIGFDLWGGFLGIELPEKLWNASAYIELFVGYLLFRFGSRTIAADDDESDDDESDEDDDEDEDDEVSGDAEPDVKRFGDESGSGPSQGDDSSDDSSD